MKTEIEVKFCQIDIDDVCRRLEGAGASCMQPMRLMRRQAFYLVDRWINAKDGVGVEPLENHKQINIINLYYS